MTNSRIDKSGDWNFHQIAVKDDPVFFAAIANQTLNETCENIGGIEVNISFMMKNANEHFKANPQFSVNCMRETIEITINDKSFDADIGFEMVDGVITDLNTIFINDKGVDRNHYWLLEYEDLVKGFIQDIETKLHKRVKDED
ncbi:MAG: hypothetical protein COB12_12520 [Flavobacterium sp.]|nr:MAG: hypothetical protein COB12_12520 [Flavobacterium sp.]